MQINGVSEFLSGFTSLFGAAGGRKNSMLSFSPLIKNTSNSDTVTISDAGSRLSVETGAKDITQLADSTKADTKSMAILERMHELATTAQEETLTDLERVDMQLEFENLREDFNNVKDQDSIYEHQSDVYGNDSSVLERMRERIANGQEWDVREVYCPFGIDRLTYDDNVEEIREIAEPGWHVLDDSRVQTVREYLEESTPVILMDAESAAKGAKYLKKKISYVQKHGNNPDEYPAKNTIWHGGLLNGSTNAAWFHFISLDGKTLTQTPLDRKPERSAEVGESYAEHDIEKIRNSAPNMGYVLDVLSEEEVAAIIPKHEIVFIKAAGTHPEDFENNPYGELRSQGIWKSL